jgi:hypothetical protein
LINFLDGIQSISLLSSIPLRFAHGMIFSKTFVDAGEHVVGNAPDVARGSIGIRPNHDERYLQCINECLRKLINIGTRLRADFEESVA